MGEKKREEQGEPVEKTGEMTQERKRGRGNDVEGSYLCPFLRLHGLCSSRDGVRIGLERGGVDNDQLVLVVRDDSGR